jgi:TetR/AcrR family transcriptional repressor of nem operon
MEAAGMTQGAFYKQFSSKGDLIAEASARALESTTSRWSDAAAASPNDPLGAVIAFYLSKGHRKEKMEGCPIVALGADAARQSAEVKASFEAGIREHLRVLSRMLSKAEKEEKRDKALAILSTMVGALTLSRVVNDPRLAQSFLDAAAESVREAASS